MTQIRDVTEKEFRQFQELIHREAGIYLSTAKKALLVGRLTRRLRELSLSSFGEYYELVSSGNETERTELLDRISTNETHFFREPHQFNFLENHVVPEWMSRADAGRMPKRVRIWSAGCSTGEEPYSLAMLLLHRLPPARGWRLEIVATDLSTRVLEKASSGIWPLAKSEEIPDRYLKQFMLKGVRSQEGKMRAGPEIRSVIRFHHLNLWNASYAIAGPFDAIFCRNVLIYFKDHTRITVVDRLLNLLTPQGYLFLGHAETVSGQTTRVRSVVPAVYTFERAPVDKGDCAKPLDVASLTPTVQGSLR